MVPVYRLYESGKSQLKLNTKAQYEYVYIHKSADKEIKTAIPLTTVTKRNKINEEIR